MIITSLKKVNNDIEILFDDGNTLLLDYRIVTDFGLRKYDSIDESKKNELLYLSNKIKIKDLALKFLSRRLHSSKELKEKLLRKGYSKEIIDEIIEELELKNYLNDSEFTKLYLDVRFFRKKIGLNRIKSELIKKGIDRKLIDDILNSIDDKFSYSHAFDLAEKKIHSLRNRETNKNKIKQKLYSFLTNRGFQSEIIIKVLKELNLDDEVIQ